MGQIRFSQILGSSMALSILVGLIVAGHRAIKQAIAPHTNQPVCLQLLPLESICYSAETVLSPRKTTAIATNLDGSWLAASDQATVQLWNLHTRALVRSLKGHTNWVSAIAISPNSRTLASGSLDGTINLWDLQTGELLNTLFAESVTSLAFSTDGTILASGSRLLRGAGKNTAYPIQLWNLTTDQHITLNPGEPVAAIALSPDGQYLAAGSSSTQVWHLPSHRLVHTLNSGDLNTVIFSTDGQLLLTGSDGVRGEDGIKMWNVSSGRLVRVLDSVAADFALTPDGSRLITTYGGTANIWEMHPFRYLGTLRGSEFSGLLAEFGLNGQAVITGGSDGVKVWYPVRSQLGKLPK
ncbi:WD40 repeat-containing protein [Leptolyngbyaceae cyanobacterium JSC-12]|nr:WD40 repeat-containing protein [Leptolyngbyaceae cyanobacterium JSC-12]